MKKYQIIKITKYGVKEFTDFTSEDIAQINLLCDLMNETREGNNLYKIVETL